MRFCKRTFTVVLFNDARLRCLEKLPVCLRPSRFGTFRLVCSNSGAELLIGSAAVKVNALGSSSVTFNHHHLNPSFLLNFSEPCRVDTYSPVCPSKQSLVVVYIHVSVHRRVKNIRLSPRLR